MTQPFQEAYLKQVAIADLFPTQVTVGMREVDIRRLRWRDRNTSEASRYLTSHRVPVVLGPNNRQYMIDRHHLTLALYEEGIAELPVVVIADNSGLSFEDFWTSLASQNWTHPFDDEGRRCAFEIMPMTIEGLMDDPF